MNCRRQPQQETIPSFNRYMVECELFTRYRPEQTVTVLIDTWWNVNTLLQSLQLQAEQVLIDTWWNVNVRISHGTAISTNCFNRYMVECE